MKAARITGTIEMEDGTVYTFEATKPVRADFELSRDLVEKGFDPTARWKEYKHSPLTLFTLAIETDSRREGSAPLVTPTAPTPPPEPDEPF